MSTQQIKDDDALGGIAVGPKQGLHFKRNTFRIPYKTTNSVVPES
jgi:hypothetical protein